jgi:hypothetical protein
MGRYRRRFVTEHIIPQIVFVLNSFVSFVSVSSLLPLDVTNSTE